ncbi:hypothetical protein N7509_006601 [Penicillium cosmopolitanum]|uniref:Mediator of RNA polymerase II transcription subunit 4 n=1 Tax=Penicillium cosmopolitanum TaxID=1131564 RepID=A0A9W9VXH5_9EURO|nr:uncharacterized protein N7509_006601 [Penicillium cosmopolitanum]KAJ5391111.1 hypothetical protein N7509_006601 [Penicillium cosmopolitanum]
MNASGSALFASLRIFTTSQLHFSPASGTPQELPLALTMNNVVQSSLTDVESKLNSLLTTLTHSPAAAGAPAAAIALLNADDTLTSTIETLRRHQENYAKILNLRNEAEQLETRVRAIVGDLERFDREIRTACDDESDSDSDSDSQNNSTRGSKPLSRKEIDYRLLLDFARRISKYNHEAAADAANGAAGKGQTTRQQLPDKDVQMSGINGDSTAEDGKEPVSSVTKNATQWLDDSANVTREVYMMPYPMEDRIRMGLMGQVQLAAGQDPDKEVERLIREAEGLGVAEAPAPAPTTDTRQDEAAKAAAQAGSVAASAPRPPPAAAPAPAPAPKPKPKGLLDLDLYDPDDDDD